MSNLDRVFSLQSWHSNGHSDLAWCKKRCFFSWKLWLNFIPHSGHSCWFPFEMLIVGRDDSTVEHSLVNCWLSHNVNAEMPGSVLSGGKAFSWGVTSLSEPVFKSFRFESSKVLFSSGNSISEESTMLFDGAISLSEALLNIIYSCCLLGTLILRCYENLLNRYSSN